MCACEYTTLKRSCFFCGTNSASCVRVRGELLKLGHVVSATAIRKLLRRNRIGPAPLRSRQTWKAFLRAQASAIVLTDFLSVDTVLLKRLYVLLYMELATRRVIWFAVTDRPDAQWVDGDRRNSPGSIIEIPQVSSPALG